MPFLNNLDGRHNRKAIDELSQFPWFQHVGDTFEDGVTKANNWREAVKACSTRAWESLQLQVGNHLAYKVNTTAYERFLEWNDSTIEINKRIDAIIEEPVRRYSEKRRLPARFKNCVAWDLTLSCQELEFSDVCRPIFFLDNVLPWYRRGHFPCGWLGPELKPGWEGPMPSGQLIVF